MSVSDPLRSLVVLTGMSGSGKHTAFKAFEDLGYFCVDNLPIPLIQRLIQMSDASGGKIEKLAVVVDIRLGEPLGELVRFFQKVKDLSSNAVTVFLDASDEVLARRYSETRRIHPLAQETTVLEGIQAERQQLSDIRSLAGLIIETTAFTVHDLHDFVYRNFREEKEEGVPNVSLVSFGFKHGIPHNSDLLFDVRFLPNPNFVSELKEKTGNDPAVHAYMLSFDTTSEILSKIHDMLEYLLPRYAEEGKTYLTVGIGCTGGRHRSVMITSKLQELLEQAGHRVNLIHRDLHNE